MRVRSPGGGICSSLETPQTLHADSVTSAPDDTIIAPLWGDRAQGLCPYNWGHPDWHFPAQRVEPSAGRWVRPCVQSQGRKQESRLSSRRGAQSCAVSTLGRTGAPGHVLRCPARALAGWVEGENVLGCVSEWDQRREFTENPWVLGPLTLRGRGRGDCGIYAKSCVTRAPGFSILYKRF